MKRRDLISSSTLIGAGSMFATSCNNADQQKQIKTYLDRIAAIDHTGHLLHSVIELNPEAMAIANAMDEERKAGKVRSALHGIPVLLKDNIDTGDKIQTTAGSLAMEGFHAPQDAFLVKKLRDAGALILGKTNLSEWANFRSPNSCSGWSSRGGQTKNPYIHDHNPCGSSSGSGMAVAANLWVVALLFLLPTLAFAQHKTWKLVWSDEFNYSGLPDTTKWTAEVGGDGWGNNELQYYTSGRLENARVANGLLTIEARKEGWQDKQFTSARLITRNKGDWQYGKIEVRARLPKGRGTWSAIWMLASTNPIAWPDDGEIDIMEHVGFNQGFVHASVHCKKYYHSIGTQKTDTIQIKDCSENFHVYSVEWNKEEVKVLADGKLFFQFKNEHSGYDAWPFDNKMFLLLNVAVGGNWGGAKGVDESIWPQIMEVDYVRVFQ